MTRKPPPARCALPLPAGYRVADQLAFHARDGQGLAERVGPSWLEKGLPWHGRPARLRIEFAAGEARGELAVDGGRADPRALEVSMRRMLGLDQDIAAFERRYRHHPQLGRLVANRRGLRVPVAASPFEALVWAITGQQISVAVAIGLRRRLIAACGAVHSSGIACHPDAVRIAALGEDGLRAAGYSRAKAATLAALAADVASGALPLDAWADAPNPDAIAATLLARRGIGPWTVDYALLRGYGHLDGSLHGDVAVRRKLGLLLGLDDKPSAEFTRDWLAAFAPWRALVAAHLWAMPA